MKNKLNAAVIGLGVGAKHAKIFNSDKRINLVYLCDFNKKKINFFKKIYKNCKFVTDDNKIFKDPKIDIVSIASYDNYHAKHILKAIKYKKHFFVEKPFCLNISELSKICSNLNKNKKIMFSSNLILRNKPVFLNLNSRIKENFLGRIYYCEGDYNYGRIDKILKGWRGRIPFYSVTLGGSIHLIDLIIWLSKKKVISVIADGNKISTRNSKFKYQDIVTSLLKFENGMTAKVTANFGSVTPHHHILSIYGTKSAFFYNNSDVKYYRSRVSSKYEKFRSSYSNVQKSQLLRSFIDSVYFKRDLKIIKEREVIDLMCVCLSIEKSLKTKKWEKVKYINYKN